MAASFGSGTVRVTTPESYDAKPAPRARRRALEGQEHTDEVVAALSDSELTLVENVQLTPRRDRDLGDASANRPGKVELEVDVPPGEDVVVLLERDGVYSWHLPVNPAERTRSLDEKPRTARFEITVQAGPAPARPRKGTAQERRTRGLLGSLVQGVAQALVFRFVAPPLLEKAVDRMEQHVRPGLVHLADTEVASWQPLESLDELNLSTDRPVRVLLLVHGTFSSTAGAFGAWAVDENGQGFLRTVLSAYDAVIGFDHRTLSLDPRQNAEDLLARLRGVGAGENLVLDVVTHSRGGLVTRSLLEQVLPASGWSGVFDKVVFVAATNGGTHLADPERWHDLVDLYTNLAVAGARALGLVPGAAPAAAIVGGVVRGIGAFVKYLVAYAAEGDDVPGLKAMLPKGAFVTELNKEQEGQPGPGTSWYVISSDFHVKLFDDHHNPPEFPRELAVKLAEGLVDRLFKGGNDLVVDTASMVAIGPASGGFVHEHVDLGENDVVYHTNYFGQLAVIEAIAGWLPLGMGAGGGPELETAEPPPPEPPAAAGPPPAGAPPPEPTTGSPPPERPAGAAPPTRSRGPGRGAAPPELTEASLAAEMPARVVSKEEFAVRVRLSRRELEAGAGTVHEEQQVQVDAERPLNVEVIGKTNVGISGPAHDVFELPAGGGTSELQFTAKALAPGKAVVKVVVRQGTVVNATMTLVGTAVTKGEAEDTADAADPAAPVVTAEAHTGVDAPELEGLPCIDIVERELPQGSVVFHYAVRLETGKPPVFFESKPIKDRQERIAKFLVDVADVWQDSDADPRERERKLQDIGAKLFDELFPEDMQAYLWKHRSKVENLILYADEPFVPWELVHLKPPKGPRPAKPRFLAQSGLVRWQLGSFPPAELRVRKGRARSLCPEYLDPQFALTAPVQERLFLEEQFDAEPVTATPAGVRDLLRSGRFDLLHFSGHGAADSDDILDAKLLLKGRKRGNRVDPQYLGATTVSENATRTGEDGVGPIVVLNACQVGRSGELLTTVGGFAKAFLDAGASAFVSCLWSVHQEPSRVFVERLYEELLDGTPMATASARAREETRKAGDATWLAFVVYARPDAVLVRS